LHSPISDGADGLALVALLQVDLDAGRDFTLDADRVDLLQFGTRISYISRPAATDSVGLMRMCDCAAPTWQCCR